VAGSNVVPFSDPVVESDSRTLTRAWEQFFRKIQDVVNYSSDEQSFTLVNNQAGAADLTPLTFDYRYTSQAVIEYVIQRTSSSAELIQTGMKIVVYKPRANTWSILEYGTSGPDASGVTFTITSSGQVQYTTTNQGGTIALSRIVFRVREIKAKSSTYSNLG
jgi:hypothetical protein